MIWRTRTPVGVLELEEREGVLVRLARTEAAPCRGLPSAGVLTQAAGELEEYFAGRRREFTVPFRVEGTAFQQAVWRELRTIPYGETRTYGQLARALGKPGASRAVGRACGQNPLLLLQPCHRVVGAGGELRGFAAGPETKGWLLAHEQKA